MITLIDNQQSYVRSNAFGSISGLLQTSRVLAVELANDQPKIVTQISASLRLPSGETKTSEPFLLCAVAIFRGKVSEFVLDSNPLALEGTQNLEHLRFFYDYDGFTETIYVNTQATEVLSVILFAPLFESNLTTQQDCFGSLSVFGSFAQEKSLFEVAN